MGKTPGSLGRLSEKKMADVRLGEEVLKQVRCATNV